MVGALSKVYTKSGVDPTLAAVLESGMSTKANRARARWTLCPIGSLRAAQSRWASKPAPAGGLAISRNSAIRLTLYKSPERRLANHQVEGPLGMYPLHRMKSQ